MKRKIAFILIIIVISPLLFAGGNREVGRSPEADLDGKIEVFVSILPQKYFVEMIAGDRVDVQVMVPPGKSPATYEPSPRQMLSLGAADIFFTIGVLFEENFIPVIKANLPDLSVVDTDRGIEKHSLEAHEHEGDEDEGDEHEGDEHEGDEHEEPNAGDDPHIWMDPILVIHQAAIIRDGLIEADPDGRDVYLAGFENFKAELEELNRELSSILEPVKGSVIFVYHPSFGYFAERYGLEQVAVETGGREPNPALLEKVVEHAQDEGVKVIFVQPEFPRSSAEAVARAIGGAVIPAAPLRGDYMNNMKEIALAVREGLLE
ncbi:MAG: zinc ABC transporter substrate-binding protein [Spirochaetales bacterium]|nr:zinc ABC transporter substrate-binding protein [Spirochaetales bacterium]